MNAFLFPGQGSQYVGMGIDSYREHGTVRDIFDRANSVLGYRLTEIMFDGPLEDLTRTENAQPALFLHSYSLFQILKDPNPGMAAGHSLGEYTALAVAGAITFDDALRLVQVRAEAMAEAGDLQKGTMAAIVGMADADVEAICRQASHDNDVVVPANFNSDGQIVVSGTPEAVGRAIDLAKEAGARMARELNVSGAFHSPLMKPAEEKLASALQKVTIVEPDFPVYMNVSAVATTRPDDIRDSLVKQLTGAVRWTSSVRNMAADGATDFIEVGPGNVLQKLAGRILENPVTAGVDKLDDVRIFNEEKNG